MNPFSSLITLLIQLINAVYLMILPVLFIFILLLFIPTMLLVFLT